MSPSPSGSCPDVWSDASCSGRGVCIGPDLCQCTAEGWIGQADFTYGTPSCSVQQTTVQVLYGLLFVACLFEAPLTGFALYRRVFFRAKSTTDVLDILVHGSRWLNLCFLGAMGMLRATRPLETIGNEVAVTLMYAFAWPCALVCGAAFLIRLMLINAQFLSNAELRGRIDVFRKYLVWPLVLPLLAFSSPVFVSMLFVNTYTSRYQLIIVHFVGSALAFFVLIVPSILYVFNPFIHAIAQSLNVRSARLKNDEDTTTLFLQNLLVKFQRIRAAFVAYVVYSGMVGIPFGLIPILNRAGASYFIPVQMISWEILCSIGTVGVLRESEVRYGPFFVRFLYGLVTLGSRQTSSVASGVQNRVSSSSGKPQELVVSTVKTNGLIEQ